MQDIVLDEDHPLAFNLSFAISLGLVPASLSLKTTGCGIKKSGLPAEEDESENTGNQNNFAVGLGMLFFLYIFSRLMNYEFSS